MKASYGKRVSGSLWTFVFLLISLFLNFGAKSTKSCVCLRDTLTYNCTVMGSNGGATVWTGTAFDCSPKEITLLHNDYRQDDGAYGECNNGDIVGRSLGVENNSYISQLNVTVTANVIGKTITCVNDAASETVLFSETIINTTGPLPPPNNVYLRGVNFDSRALTFTWSSVAPDCHSLHYNILASNCGSCPTTTTNTTITCTDVPTDGSVCTFALQTVICGNIVGGLSDAVNVTSFLNLMDEENSQKGNSGCTGTITTTILFAILLFLWVSVSTIIIIILAHKAKIKLQTESELRPTTSTSSTIKQERKSSAIDTSDNTAYGLIF